MNDLTVYKGRQVTVVYHENPNDIAQTIKGYCFEASEDFIHLLSSGKAVTSIRREWIRKIKTRGGEENAS